MHHTVEVIGSRQNPEGNGVELPGLHKIKGPVYVNRKGAFTNKRFTKQLHLQCFCFSLILVLRFSLIFSNAGFKPSRVVTGKEGPTILQGYKQVMYSESGTAELCLELLTYPLKVLFLHFYMKSV